MTEEKEKKFHLNIQLTQWERVKLEKYCNSYGTKTLLIRKLIHRFLKEMEEKE